MTTDIIVLGWTAASIGFVHTLIGPDHYLPFIVMSKARRWSMKKTGLIAFLCGLGHVLSSVIIGFIGIGFTIGVMNIKALEGFRGNLAAWFLIGFGFAYFAWGMHRALKGRSHTHSHTHDLDACHLHSHSHKDEHAHVHKDNGGRSITPWILFTIFVFGPCEPLIPLLMYPAAKSSIWGVVLVIAIFGTVTIATMLGIIMVSAWGISFARFGKLERYTHALAGGAICLSGLAIQFLGL